MTARLMAVRRGLYVLGLCAAAAFASRLAVSPDGPLAKSSPISGSDQENVDMVSAQAIAAPPVMAGTARAPSPIPFWRSDGLGGRVFNPYRTPLIRIDVAVLLSYQGPSTRAESPMKDALDLPGFHLPVDPQNLSTVDRIFSGLDIKYYAYAGAPNPEGQALLWLAVAAEDALLATSALKAGCDGDAFLIDPDPYEYRPFAKIAFPPSPPDPDYRALIGPAVTNPPVIRKRTTWPGDDIESR